MTLPEPYRNPRFEGLTPEKALEIDPRLSLLMGLGIAPVDLTDDQIEAFFSGQPIARQVIPGSGGYTVEG